MAMSPQILGPDGQYRTTFAYSTDTADQFFSGRCDPDTADMQIALRSDDFQSDPDLVTFEGETFIIPNPAVYPDGITLLPGSNLIQVRSVLSNGDSTSPASLDITLSLERDVKSGVLAPTDVSVERMDRTVKIAVRGGTDPAIMGYNVYGSAAPGGGLTGYKRINPSLITAGATEDATSTLGEMTADAVVATNPDGTPIADPTYLQVLGVETSRPVASDLLGDTLSIPEVIKTDYHQVIVIPDTTSRVRTILTVESVDTVQIYSFVHDRRSVATSSLNPAIPNSEFLTLADSDPIYYVVTALYLIDNQQYESPYSPELAAAPLVVTPVIASLPSVSHAQIVQDFSLSIFRTHPEAGIAPGSFLRDTTIDPFATEAERIRFIVGFVQNCQSFATLLAIDDPGYTGTSVPVAQSPYKQAIKQAFYLQSDQDVQNIIDNAFDRLASSRGQTRSSGKRSRGEVTIYTIFRPTTTYNIPIGTAMTGGGITIRSTSTGQITSTGAGSSYNPATGRYMTRVFVQADQPGTAGNVAEGQIRTLMNGSAGLQVINETKLYGGYNAESNRDLAVRCDRIIASVDSGTAEGLYQRAIGVPGVREVNIVGAGNSLMMRDLDATGRHTGGKVDIWLRGDNLARITDRFAFSFELVINGQFEPVGSLNDLRFRVINESVTESNPIIQMIENAAWGYVFKDLDTGKVFDLTDVLIESPDTIVLSPDYNTPASVSLTDRFVGTYRFRTSDKHVFARQPVDSIVSLVGDQSGVILSSDYALYPGSVPLELGRSIEAGDYLQVSTDATIPSSEALSTPSTGESHTLIDRTEYLNNLGINPITVRVWDTQRVTEYYGPYYPTSSPDFSFIPEMGETPLALYLTAGSRLEAGMTVLVDYEYDENFTVTYVTDSMVSSVQNAMDPHLHVTADILSKDALATGIDLEATIVLQPGYTQSSVDGPVRTALARFFGSLKLGQALRQSDVVGVIESVMGVSYVVIPIIRMTKTDGSMVLREDIVTTNAKTDYTFIEPWSTVAVDVYLLTNPLSYGTVGGGGNLNDSKGVFVTTLDPNLVPHTIDLECYSAPPNPNGIPIREVSNAAFIIGNEGLWIPGYSDDDTLKQRYPFATDEERSLHRVQITANRVLVALPKGTVPSEGTYQLTYVVYGDSGVKNIEPSAVEYLELGTLNFVYDEDRCGRRV